MRWFYSKQTEPVPLYHFRHSVSHRDIEAVMVSDKGNVRSNNEDGVMVTYPMDEALAGVKGILLLLADGMGGHNSGEIASQLALTTFADAYFGQRRPVCRSLKSALQQANEAILAASQTEPNYAGMGTTLTALLLLNESLYMAHIGDSRAYLFNQNKLQQLSTDHTLVQQMIGEGLISEWEAHQHPDRNILLQALGTRRHAAGDILQVGALTGADDMLLLCSDGLHDLVSDDEMWGIVKAAASIESAAQQLVDTAKRRGGYDNITVLLAGRRKPASPPQLKATRDSNI